MTLRCGLKHVLARVCRPVIANQARTESFVVKQCLAPVELQQKCQEITSKSIELALRHKHVLSRDSRSFKICWAVCSCHYPVNEPQGCRIEPENQDCLLYRRRYHSTVDNNVSVKTAWLKSKNHEAIDICRREIGDVGMLAPPFPNVLD